MKGKTFLQKHLAKIIGSVLIIALFGTFAVLRYQQKEQREQEFRDKLTMFKKPPVDAAEGGHWHADGTWHNEPHPRSKERFDPHPKTTEKSTEPHPHDSLTDEEHAEIHRKEEEIRKRGLERLAEAEKRLEEAKARLNEADAAELANMERQEFEQLMPNFQKQILEYEDYDFILTYPTPAQIIEKFSTPESLDAFCKRLKKFQSLILEISDEIHKREAFARSMYRKYPDFMDRLKQVSELEIPQLYAEGTQ